LGIGHETGIGIGIRIGDTILDGNENGIECVLGGGVRNWDTGDIWDLGPESYRDIGIGDWDEGWDSG
jgi:hypothetical protein